jgi:hypothetical protein
MHLVLESHKSDQLQQIFHIGAANLEIMNLDDSSHSPRIVFFFGGGGGRRY